MCFAEKSQRSARIHSDIFLNEGQSEYAEGIDDSLAQMGKLKSEK